MFVSVLMNEFIPVDIWLMGPGVTLPGCVSILVAQVVRKGGQYKLTHYLAINCNVQQLLYYERGVTKEGEGCSGRCCL